jgi:hypothetical protein
VDECGFGGGGDMVGDRLEGTDLPHSETKKVHILCLICFGVPARRREY